MYYADIFLAKYHPINKHKYFKTSKIKFHCELNPIEGVWCYLKYYVRKHDDQDFYKFFGLIDKSIEVYQEKNLNIKLWNRFWRALEMYSNGKSCQEVQQTLFGAKSDVTVSHKKITNVPT
jgi:hypothetical protein